MMVKIIAFTLRGGRQALKIQSELEKSGVDAQAFCFYKYAAQAGAVPVENVKQWCADNWSGSDGLVFVSATGIAVRSIATFVKSKKEDPAVAVVDESGKFSISLLSGHIGGANDLAVLIADKIGAIPVVTTATDVNGKIAIDVMAKKNELFITSMFMAKEVSAAVLAGENIGFFSDIPVENGLPDYFAESTRCRINVKIGIGPAEKDTLLLVPEKLCLGIGCKRGTACADIEKAVDEFLSVYDIAGECVSCAASIDLKKDEAGLLEFCEKRGIKITFYSAEKLNSAAGKFTQSEFVRQKTGVDCVCERAAVLNTGGKLLVGKTRFSGITLALARKEMRIRI